MKIVKTLLRNFPGAMTNLNYTLLHGAKKPFQNNVGYKNTIGESIKAMD